MIALLYALLRTLFPHDPVARLRELTRDYIHWLIRPLSDPRAIDHLQNNADARHHLLSHITVIEQGVNLLAHHRARQLLALPFEHRDAAHRHPVRDKSVDAIVSRLTRLVALFDNLETLAARRAQRMQRDPLRLDAAHRSTSPSLRLVEANRLRAFNVQIASISAQHWGRWIGATSRRDGGGGAFATGPPSPHSIPYSLFPIPHCLAATCENAPVRPKQKGRPRERPFQIPKPPNPSGAACTRTRRTVRGGSRPCRRRYR